ncbi:unnamed protein product [Leptosia nina]|uniref:Uncharacterized protein n=1 Tax=Leptosia nina TaxID=320188 RepID=A0AAV1J8I6_9NEOP
MNGGYQTHPYHHSTSMVNMVKQSILHPSGYYSAVAVSRASVRTCVGPEERTSCPLSTAIGWRGNTVFICTLPRLGRLHPYGSGSGSSSGSRRRGRRGLSESPTPTTPTSASDNASDATLTDSELPLARDSTLLVQNAMTKIVFIVSSNVLDLNQHNAIFKQSHASFRIPTNTPCTLHLDAASDCKIA